jgi:hypothetical protein
MNRRLNHRHQFEQIRQPWVQLDSVWQPLRIEGRLRDLSIGGMNVQISDTATSLNLFRLCLAELEFTREERATTMTAELVHVRRLPCGLEFGMRFLPLVEPLLNAERQKVLSLFLLQQQLTPDRKVPAPGLGLFYPRLFIPDAD